MGATVDASVAGTAALVINAPRERWLLSIVCSFVGVRSLRIALSASDFLGRESRDGVHFGLGEADARGGEVLMEVLDAGGAGDRQRSGGAVKLPGERDLLRRDVVFGGDRVDHRVKRRAFGAVGDGGGVPGGEDDAGLLGDLADRRP